MTAPKLFQYNLYSIARRLLASACILFFCISNLSSQYEEKIYGLEHGLSHRSVTHITQDQDGFIWVHTFRGVNRFDGQSFREYKLFTEKGENSTHGKSRFSNTPGNKPWFFQSDGRYYYYDRADEKLKYYFNHYWEYTVQVDDLEGNLWLFGYGSIIHQFVNQDDSIVQYFFAQPDTHKNILDAKMADDGSMILLSVEGINRLFPDSLSIRSSKIHLYKHGSEEVFKVGWFDKLIRDDNYYFILSENRIYKTDISCSNQDLDDTISQVELLDLNFPEINLHPVDQIHKVEHGDPGELFIRSDYGIYRYNYYDDSVELIRKESYGDADEEEGNFRRALLYTPDKVLWFGTDYGLGKIVFGNKAFKTIKVEPGKPSKLGFKKLSQVLVDSYGDLWIGTTGDGLYRSKPDAYGDYNSFDHYLPISGDSTSLYTNSVSALFEDSKKRLWVGANNIQWIDLGAEEVSFKNTNVLEVAKQLNRRVQPYPMLEDADGNIIVPGYYSEWIVESDGRQVYHIVKDSLGFYYNRVNFCITENKQIYHLNDSYFISQKRDAWDFLEIQKKPGVTITGSQIKIMSGPAALPRMQDTIILFDTINANYLSCMISEKKDVTDFWFSLFEEVNLIRYRIENTALQNGNSLGNIKANVDIYSPENGFQMGFIHEIAEDKNGWIWCSTEDGLAVLSPGMNTLYHYYVEDGLPTNMLYNGSFIDSTGRVFICSMNGLMYFHPDSIINEPPPKVFLTELELDHKAVGVGDSSILRKSILETEFLKLKHNENFLSLRFAALDYRNTSRISYKYILEGMDNDWITADNSRIAYYPNLAPGKYTFRVIAANGNGIWNEDGASLNIRIMKPIWFRWWAFAIESVIFVLLLMLIIRKREKNLRYRARLLEETVEEKTRQILEQRKDVDEMKSRFYTNISHEFRTPLTLLIGPLEDSMKSDLPIGKQIKRVMLRNARRLQRLINQLLDISKLESGNMELQLVKAKLDDFCRTIASSFLSLAESNQIKYTIEIENPGKEVCFDADKIEKVLTNLLSNAFKFTDKGGTVNLNMGFEPEDRNINQLLAFLSVNDTGRGMAPEQLDRIFDRFYQVSDNDTREVEGSGIGLALTKELVDFMHGEISVESQPGKGTTFRISIPVSESSFTKTEIAEMQSRETVVTQIEEAENLESVEKTEAGQDSKKEVILVVEDNPDLRKYIKDQFKNRYKVIDAKNGKTGFEKALKILPDLIITDLMMPVMGGMELCRKLKESPVTNHIPLIMLTAKADKESKLEGLEAAADDYIIKPFNSEELVARSRNLILQRQDLRNSFEKTFMEASKESVSASPQYKMLREIMELFEANISDPDFTVEVMAKQLFMSRSQLYRKVQSVTGSSPNYLIRLTRMKRAAAFLRRGELNVTQVMYQVGMKNPSNFAIMFKKYYGVNPGKYRDQGSRQ